MRAFVSALLLFALAMQAMPKSHATGTVRDIAWAQLVPSITSQSDLRARSFVQRNTTPGASPSADPASPPPDKNLNVPEAGWMSMRAQQPGGPAAQAVVEGLNGQRIRIGGYVVALDFDATKITEFLLVPFVGACIHVPPPPPNQIIYVKAEEPFEIGGQFDPVYVTGVIRTSPQFTGLAATGYTIEAASVASR